MSLRQLAINSLIVLATFLGLLIAWEFRGAAIMFLISLAIAAALRPVIEWLHDHRIPYPLALVGVYAVVLSGLATLGYFIGTTLLMESEHASADLLRLHQWMTAGPGKQGPIGWIAQYLPWPEATNENQRNAVAFAFLGIGYNLFHLVAHCAIVLALAVYWTADRVHFERLWLSVLPPEFRERARSTWQSLDLQVGTYLRSELAQSVLAGLVLYGTFQLLRLPYPTLLAMVGAIVWLVPWIGVILVLVPIGLVGLLVSPLHAGLAMLAAAILFLVLEHLVEPRLFNRRQFSAVLMVIVAYIMTDAWGLPGLLAAPVLAVSIQILYCNAILAPRLEASAEDESPIEIVRRRLQTIERMIGDRGEAPSPEVKALLDRLAGLVREVAPSVATQSITSTPAAPPSA